MKNYKNTPDASIGGTSFTGKTITCSYTHLVRAVGEPAYEDRCDIEDKVTCEWTFTDPDGNVFTIYDWKEYRYFSVDDEIEWHIGARHGEGSSVDFAVWVQARLVLIHMCHTPQEIDNMIASMRA